MSNYSQYLHVRPVLHSKLVKLRSVDVHRRLVWESFGVSNDTGSLDEIKICEISLAVIKLFDGDGGM